MTTRIKETDKTKLAKNSMLAIGLLVGLASNKKAVATKAASKNILATEREWARVRPSLGTYTDPRGPMI